ncbi:MAG TPA: four helix bundle protein [Pirellulales bacterium]|jgi:four helix bundle protein|nr:four helix bundle protein [Pirellulales bacterium]
MKVDNYRDLIVWQRSVDVAHAIRQSTLAFPKHETFGLASQIQRAAVSIPANIAEGHERESTKEYLYHLSVAQGSRAELETHLTLAEMSGYLEATEVDQFLKRLDEIGKMIRAIQKSLKKKISLIP